MARWSDLNKWQWRKQEGVVQRKINVRIYDGWDSFTMDDLREKIEETGITDEITFELETESGSYGDSDRAVLNLQGWRDATDAEIKDAYKEIDEAKANQAQILKQRAEQAAAELARLQKEHPELFKEG